MMALSMWLTNWFFGIKSPSRHFATLGKNICKGIKSGKKIAKKEFRKYKKAWESFERKWNKQNASWRDCRHKRKACAKAFVKAFPKYDFHIELERMGHQCKKY